MVEAMNARWTGVTRTPAFSRLADALAVAAAASLPWWTSPTGILIGLWLVALLPTLDWARLRRELMTPAGGLPVALWAFAALGMLWADMSFAQRLHSLGAYHKLLIIPLLLAQFRRSERGWQVVGAYLVSVSVLLVLSSAQALWPAMPGPRTIAYGVPVKDYIAQSAEFVACAFGLLYFAGEASAGGRRRLALGSVALALALLANVAYVATSRTSLVVIPVLLVMLGTFRMGWKGALACALAGTVLAAAAWTSSPYLRARVQVIASELADAERGEQQTSGSQRLAYWTRSMAVIAQAPVAGHGTQPVTEPFRRAAEGASGAVSVVTANPHNQILAIGIQLGLVGTALLAAMWIAHLFLFREGGLACWLGLVIVVQNIVSSAFNSHLFDFTQGWTYVFGVGVLGGLALRRAPLPLRPASAAPLQS
jgi:hypothetical protein